MAGRSITFELSERDVVAATRLGAARRIPFRLPLLLAVAVAAALLGLWAYPENELIVLLGSLVLLVAALVALTYFWFVPWQARLHFRQLAAARGKTSFAWSDSGTVLTGTKGETRLDWADYHCWMESDELLLLFQSLRLFNLVPKAALDGAQLLEIRGFLAAAKVRQR